MKKVGVAVIGTGFWGRNHARAYTEIDSAKLIAVCDVDPARAQNIANQFGVRAYTNSTLMLKNPEIEAVSVCTWSTILAKEALKSLNMGKHVLVEKPMATNTKQAYKLVETADECGLKLTVGFLMRFIPGLQNVKKAIESKSIGEFVCATAKRVSQWPDRIGDVGVVKDTAIHDIDVMRFITKEDPITVYAKTGSMRHREFEDYAQIMLTYKDGRSAFIESNWLTPYKTRTLTVTGSDAILKLDYITQELLIEKAKESIQPRSTTLEPLKAELEHFTNSIINNERPKVTGIDGLKALEIAQAALWSSTKNKAIKLDN
jgi:UDP-N-acetylglucosamine 3-dehydrogenase